MATAGSTLTPAGQRRWAVLDERPVRVLLVVSVLSLAGLVVAGIGLATDPDQITGVPGWIKPAKFAVSIAVYCATLGWMLSLVRGHQRLVRGVAWVTAAALLVELVLIDLQVVRGTTSHFNTATPFDANLFSAMGGLVSLVFLAAAVAGVLVARQRDLPPVLAVGIRGGVLVSLIGMAEAGLMLANRAYGGDSGGHTIGAPDGGPGLPVTGWSLEHGDLRVAHFAGLHALQALPILAWALHRYLPRLGGPRVDDVVLSRLMVVATVAYGGLVVLLAWQAERALPLLRPDATILLAGFGLLAGAGAAVAVVLLRGARR